MTTPAEPLVIEPTELTYENDYSMNQLRKLIISNPNQQLMLVFKVKLSHRELYQVTPSMAGKATIDIVLRPFNWTPSAAEKNRILIQALNVEEKPNDLKEVFDQGQMPLDVKINVTLPPPQ
ncbi:Integral ER membrane protein Scs2 [Trichuris trichiura]|uniref:Integral ER membrane protein Scs2 n=1 Tax=Trichuris trichiura TaxID=36087 RepID=A0A077YZP2_TRITR|nr:Integral ER membrane protein Scs2 [Trichuris trichiura]